MSCETSKDARRGDVERAAMEGRTRYTSSGAQRRLDAAVAGSQSRSTGDVGVGDEIVEFATEIVHPSNKRVDLELLLTGVNGGLIEAGGEVTALGGDGSEPEFKASMEEVELRVRRLGRGICHGSVLQVSVEELKGIGDVFEHIADCFDTGSVTDGEGVVVCDRGDEAGESGFGGFHAAGKMVEAFASCVIHVT